MKNNVKKIPLSVVLMFAVAAVLLVFSTVGGARAALTITSGEYDATMSMDYIGITLLENDTEVNFRNYPGGNETKGSDMGTLSFGQSGEDFKFGTTYDEVLKVKNSGTIDEYVRVTITKYWADEKGNKDVSLDPELIDLKLDAGNVGFGKAWFEDSTQKTKERTVLYCANPITPGTESAPFTTTVTVKNAAKTKMSQVKETTEVDGKTVTKITTTYDYGDKYFHVEVKADGVQTHNPADALKSAWGVTGSFSGTTLTGVSN